MPFSETLAADLAPWFVRLVAFLFGAVWGSFFNVAIYRWPRGMSVVHPPSHCPSCGAPVRPHHNVPILGWLWLRGRAACCGAPLSARYPLVELLAALLAVGVAERDLLGAPPGTFLDEALLETLLDFAFLGGLLVATFVDFDWMEIPDEVSLPGAALGLLTVSLRPTGPGAEAAAIGAGLGFLLVQVPFVWLYERLRGRRGMGEGDAKLLLFVGAFVGWRGVLFALFAGALQGLLYTLGHLLLGRDPGARLAAEESAPSPDEQEGQGAVGETPPGDPSDAEGAEEDDGPDEEEGASVGLLKVPFGPFLSLGAVEYYFFGPTLLEAYVRWVAGV